MKNNICILLYITVLIVSNLTISCKKNEQKQEQLPALTTIIASEITQTTAICGGDVSSDGGVSVISRGVCWSLTTNPTTSNNKTTDGSGTGAFLSSVTGLIGSTTYFVRAYATNNTGTSYGNEISFTTTNTIIPEFNISKVIDGKEIRSISKTNDGGYIGVVFSEDYEVLKFDSAFNLTWDKTYGGSKGDYIESIIQSNDGGYIAIGETKSSDGNITLNHGGNDIWICKLDAEGNLIWERSYGGTNSEGVSKENSLLQTSDGGYVFIGYTTSSDGDVSLNHGGYDVWLVKISSLGAIEYEKTFGGTNNDYGRKIIKTNSSFTLLISSTSENGDFNIAGNWVIQINELGGLLWKTNLLSTNSGSICTTIAGEIVVVNTGMLDYSLNKLNSDGSIKQTKTISFQSISSKQPSATKILPTADNGFIIIGSIGNGNDADALLYRVTPDFNLIYSKIYSGSTMDMSSSIIPIKVDQYIYQFFTASKNIPNINYSSAIASVVVTLEE
jgi:hypothetical protein